MTPIDLSYDTFGEGYPVILIHGFPLNRSIWYPLLPYLEKDLMVILPDLRGHGKSNVVEGEYLMSELAQDILALMDKLHIEKAVIAGHSMGGYVALEVLHQQVDRVSGLGLIASHAEADPKDRVSLRLRMADRLEREGIDFLAEDMANRLTTHVQLVPKIKKIILQNSAYGAARVSRGMAKRSGFTMLLPILNIPALVIGGESDSLNPLERVNKTAEALKNSRLLIIPGGGHMPMMEAPELTAQALLELCQRAKNNR